MRGKIKKIGVLTSGGDSPGMNAATRSVVRKAVYEGLEVVGIMRGYEGLMSGELMQMNSRSVSNILGLGGTILKTSRSKEFMTGKGQAKAVKVIQDNGIDALVINGGNGSLQGALVLQEKWKIRSIGLPGTIDNDLGHTDYTIGAHTSVDTVLDAIDKIRDTVTSMERIFVVEVMGRREPYIAVMAGLAGGAEEVLYPGSKVTIKQIAADIRKAEKKGKRSWIIVVSEGYSDAQTISKKIKKATGYETRGITLGHVQRGGSPNAPDRVLASEMGAFAVEALIKGHTGKMVGIQGNKLKLIPYEKACFDRDTDMERNSYLYTLTRMLSI
ncbi:MAG: 6-phosphofructokinase [Candidatus Omnitrophica bacterium]|nr:6-phosphofructokinase [Candidatus Omnitrophota bacterium]MDD5487551.1 6-phosphofructokinase [Candidatus Omnitrophota bacterium]